MLGQTLGHYRILDKLGEGGMGEVYRAEDLHLKRQVALKVLAPDLATNRERLERFRREAQVLAALEHPNIVNVHSVESVDGLHFLTMELIDGETLAEAIPRQGMTLRELFSSAIPMADALSKAHERGIVHRDFKPTNVMLTREGVVKVLDFGLAKIEPQEESRFDSRAATEVLTGEGRILGTVPYMSPEQLKGEPADHRSDIFSLGIVLYQAATGHRPFGGNSSAEVQSAILRDTPPPVDKIRRDAPHHLGRIINGCLEKDPEARYQSAKDVRNDLARLRTELTSGEMAVPDRPGSFSPRDRPKWAWSGGVATIIVVLLLYWFIGRPGPGPEEDSPETPPIHTVDGEAQALLDQGFLAEMRGDTRENLAVAEEKYRRALALEPNNPAILGRLAALLARAQISYPSEERPSQIRGLTRAALDQVPDLPEAVAALGQLALIEGDTDAAAEEARKLISIAPDDYRGYTLLGEAYVGAGHTDEGLIQLRRGVELAGTDVRARLALATKLRHIGRNNEAAAEYEIVLEYKPDSPNALANLATIYGKQGRYLDAIPPLKRLVDQYDDEVAAMNLANCYLYLGRLDEAIAAYEKTIELAPERPFAYQGLAEAYEMQGEAELARKSYEEAIGSLDEQIEQGGGPRAKFYGTRAVCHAKLGQQDKAIADIDEALTLAPERVVGHFNAAQVYALLGDRERAYDYMKRAIESGYGREEFDNDLAFAALRDEPEFRALIEAPATR